jgi:iron transport multicopper oxidase
LLVSLATRVLAETVTLNWGIGWSSLAPDGFTRPVITVNQQWPAPTINLKNGDRLILHFTNNLGNETASIHFHGLKQHLQNIMDGPAAATQCPIPPGSRFTYDFTGRLLVLCLVCWKGSNTDPKLGEPSRHILVACPCCRPNR